MAIGLQKKIMLVYGTRPEFIKLAPLILELRNRKQVSLVVVNTGQHKEMVDDLEDFFGIQPDYKLKIMVKNQHLNGVLSKVIEKITTLFEANKPEVVIVQGDTTSVLGVALAAYNCAIPVAHVEAGLRSGDLNNPFPEELNRKTVSLFATYNFAPTALTAKNLIKEKVDQKTIFVTGNTVVDALKLVVKKSVQPTGTNGRTIAHSKRRVILITAHRRENHGKGIEGICRAVIDLVQMYADVEFIWPVHPNPNVKKMVFELLGSVDRVRLTPPLSYFELIQAMNASYMIWTDSGGIQEEAPTLKKPILILRKLTERPEVILSGFGKLVGTDTSSIIAATQLLLNNKKNYALRIAGKNPFGDGQASKRIARILTSKQFE